MVKVGSPSKAQRSDFDFASPWWHPLLYGTAPVYDGTGCFWGLGEAPVPALPGQKVLKTDTFTLTINELIPGAPIVSIETTSGAKLSFTPTGAELSVTAGQLALSGLQITLNNDALVVLP